MSKLTTHILDTELGVPAKAMALELEKSDKDHLGPWHQLAKAVTNDDGRVKDWSSPFDLKEGIYRITFYTGEYFKKQSRKTFYPMVQFIFQVHNAKEHHHVPLLLSAHGLSTYRGS